MERADAELLRVKQATLVAPWNAPWSAERVVDSYSNIAVVPGNRWCKVKSLLCRDAVPGLSRFSDAEVLRCLPSYLIPETPADD